MTKRANQVRKLAKALKFAQLISTGHTQTEAWRAITPNWQTIKPDSQYAMASEFARDPLVKLKVDEVILHASRAVMGSATAYAARMRALAELAVERDNLTAAASFERLYGQSQAILQDRGVLTVEHHIEAQKLRELFKSNGLDEKTIDSLMPLTSFGETKH